ncbi:MAG: hypothetical protein K2X27_09025 [Candidatus Obscuribacterales bacterium]|nr:hypothetical protein [Candidatus Obscuribacterales bacterium]
MLPESPWVVPVLELVELWEGIVVLVADCANEAVGSIFDKASQAENEQ